MDIKALQSVLDAMPLGAVAHAPSGEIVAANEHAGTLLKLSMPVLLGRDSMDPRWAAVKGDGSPFPGREHPAMLALQSGRRVESTLMGVAIAGEPMRWLSVSASPFAWSGGEGEFGSIAIFGLAVDAVDPGAASRQMALAPGYLLGRQLLNRASVGVRSMIQSLAHDDRTEFRIAAGVAGDSLSRAEKWCALFELVSAFDRNSDEWTASALRNLRSGQVCQSLSFQGDEYNYLGNPGGVLAITFIVKLMNIFVGDIKDISIALDAGPSSTQEIIHIQTSIDYDKISRTLGPLISTSRDGPFVTFEQSFISDMMRIIKEIASIQILFFERGGNLAAFVLRSDEETPS